MQVDHRNSARAERPPGWAPPRSRPRVRGLSCAGAGARAPTPGPTLSGSRSNDNAPLVVPPAGWALAAATVHQQPVAMREPSGAPRLLAGESRMAGELAIAQRHLLGM